jgi:hypothetical protein
MSHDHFIFFLLSTNRVRIFKALLWHQLSHRQSMDSTSGEFVGRGMTQHDS